MRAYVRENVVDCVYVRERERERERLNFSPKPKPSRFYARGEKDKTKKLKRHINTESEGLSEQARTTYLQQKIKEARKSERSRIVISILGSTLAFFSFLFPIMIKLMYASAAFLVFFFVGILGGIIAIILGLAISIYYALEGGVLRIQQKNSEGNPDMP